MWGARMSSLRPAARPRRSSIPDQFQCDRDGARAGARRQHHDQRDRDTRDSYQRNHAGLVALRSARASRDMSITPLRSSNMALTSCMDRATAKLSVCRRVRSRPASPRARARARDRRGPDLHRRDGREPSALMADGEPRRRPPATSVRLRHLAPGALAEADGPLISATPSSRRSAYAVSALPIIAAYVSTSVQRSSSIASRTPGSVFAP